MDDIFVIYVMWMMCYICEICVVEAGNINKNKKMLSKTKKMLSGLFAESLALGKSSSLPRAWWSALGKPFFFKTTSAANLFFYNSLPTVALGKEVLCRQSLSAKKLSHRYPSPGRSRARQFAES